MNKEQKEWSNKEQGEITGERSRRACMLLVKVRYLLYGRQYIVPYICITLSAENIEIVDSHGSFWFSALITKMVHNYVRKTNRGKQYSKEILAETVLEVQSGRMSAYRTRKDFNIPLNTVIDHGKGRRGRKSTSHGRPTALPLDVEKKIAACLITMEQHGFGLSRKDILSLVGDGEKLSPPVIFKGKNLWDDWQPTKEEAFSGTSYVATENGWMETKVFINFFKITFLAHIGTERPVLVICDGHKTHISLRLIEIAREENVTILILRPHSSHILQPLDLSNQINRPHLQAGSSNEGSVVRKSAVVQAGSSIEGSVVHDSEVVQARSIYEGSVVCSKVVSQCDPNPPVEISESTSTPVQTPEFSAVGPHHSVSQARARTFQELVLETIENHQSAEKKKKTRLTKGAEIITLDDKRKLENKKNSSQKTMKSKREEMKTNTLPARKGRKQRPGMDTSSDNFSLRETDNEDENWEYYKERMKDQHEEVQDEEDDEEPSMVNTDTTNLRAGDWVLVKFLSKKHIKHYVGQVISFDRLRTCPTLLQQEHTRDIF
ncbi:hypothetical protein PR048_010461 [Dryococelus australis]|uniref:DDE-1 domain-containing protein n=1 Tax=Dryococelus australis TaxID=614101 RepID=A0ABQ9I2V2_9NEOP|nr:hypothetical protein PR048_010461 [Dryococelus australis]